MVTSWSLASVESPLAPMAPQPLTPSLPVHIDAWFGQVVVTIVRVATPPDVPIVSSYAADVPSVAQLELDEPPPPPGEEPPPPPPCGCACVIAARKQSPWTRLPVASFAGEPPPPPPCGCACVIAARKQTLDEAAHGFLRGPARGPGGLGKG